MNELMKINYESDQPTVSARELHEFLEVGTEFRHWFPRMCEYEFSEGIDYTPVIFDHPQNGQPTKDYALIIEMAKEICMIQRNEKGKLARRYFIQVEKAWNDPEQVAARVFKMSKSTSNKYKEQLAEAKLNNSRARLAAQWLKISVMYPTDTGKQTCAYYASNVLAGKEVFQLPECTEHLYTASEVADIYGTTAAMIGRISNQNNMKTDEYGKFVWDKSKYSNKQVEAFRYNAAGVEKFGDLIRKGKLGYEN